MEVVECGACNGFTVTSNKEFRVFHDGIATEARLMIEHDLGTHGLAWADLNFDHEGDRWAGTANIFIWRASRADPLRVG